MKHRGRTLVALLLTLCLVLALLPAAALAADEGPCTVTYEPNDPEHLYLDELNPVPLYLAYTAGEQAKVMPSVGNNCTVWYPGAALQHEEWFRLQRMEHGCRRQRQKLSGGGYPGRGNQREYYPVCHLGQGSDPGGHQSYRPAG